MQAHREQRNKQQNSCKTGCARQHLNEQPSWWEPRLCGEGGESVWLLALQREHPVAVSFLRTLVQRFARACTSDSVDVRMTHTCGQVP
eukprot:4258962-Pleurochrysis_carterae.AAC.2